MSDTPRNKLSLKREATSEQFKLEERLHKVLAQAGLGSRRALEQRIAEGLVKVNGEVAQTGMSVKSGDKIELDGRGFVATALAEPSRVLVYNKPEGEVTSRKDPEGRPTVFDQLPRLKDQRWIAVGRLDINTTGLMLFTTDGELANRLMHPSHEIDREYAVRIFGEVDEAMIGRLLEGVLLDDGMAQFTDVSPAGGSGLNRWFHVTLMEGRNREVRRLWESQGVRVSRLKRVRYGPIFLPSRLSVGRWEELDQKATDDLSRSVDLEPVAIPHKTPGEKTSQERLRKKQPPRSARKPSGSKWQVSDSKPAGGRRKAPQKSPKR